jgi:hypothetical protein
MTIRLLGCAACISVEESEYKGPSGKYWDNIEMGLQ